MSVAFGDDELLIGAPGYSLGADQGRVTLYSGPDEWIDYGAGVDPGELPHHPGWFTLSQNFPNPFNAASSFHYELHQKGIVRLKVFNVRGKEVKRLIDKEQPAGSYDVTFDAGDLPGGIYFYRLILITDGKNIFKACKKMILIK